MYKSLSESKEFVIVEFYQYIYNSDDVEWLSLSFIKRDICGNQISTIFLSKIISLLVEEKCLDAMTEEGEIYYTINSKGILRAEKTVLSLSYPQNQNLGIPASDRIVTIGDNQEVIDSVLADVEAAEEAIRSSNSLPEEQKSWIREHLSVGKSLLKLKKVSLSAVKSMLLTPLNSAWKYVAEEHSKTIIGKALEALRVWIGL